MSHTHRNRIWLQNLLPQVYFIFLSIALRNKNNNHITHYSFIQLFNSINMCTLYDMYAYINNSSPSVSRDMHVQIFVIKGKRWWMSLQNISNSKKRRFYFFISTLLVQMAYVLWCVSLQDAVKIEISPLHTPEPEFWKATTS